MQIPRQIPIMQLVSVPNVSTSVTSSVQLPLGGTYYGIQLRCYDATNVATVSEIKAAITEIRVKVGSQNLIRISPTMLYMLELFYGASYGIGNEDGILNIPFTRNFLKLPLAKDVLAWGTADINSLSLEIDFHSSITGISNVDIYAQRTAFKNPLGMVRTIDYLPFNLAIAGINQVSDMPDFGRSKTAGYLALHLDNGSGTPVGFEVEYNNSPIYDIRKDAYDQTLLYSERTAQAGYMSIAFDDQDNLASFLPVSGLTDFRIKPDYTGGSAPGAVNWYYEALLNIESRFLG